MCAEITAYLQYFGIYTIACYDAGISIVRENLLALGSSYQHC
jgi:hypothetical protein